MVWTSNINDMALNLVYSLNTVHMKHLYTVSPFESHLNFESFSSHSLQLNGIQSSTFFLVCSEDESHVVLK